jgi:hypothetical protein
MSSSSIFSSSSNLGWCSIWEGMFDLSNGCFSFFGDSVKLLSRIISLPLMTYTVSFAYGTSCRREFCRSTEEGKGDISSTVSMLSKLTRLA